MVDKIYAITKIVRVDDDQFVYWFGVPDEFGSPVPTVYHLAAHSPQLLGYAASSLRSKIFTCKKLFELSLYDRAGIDFDIKSI